MIVAVYPEVQRAIKSALLKKFTNIPKSWWNEAELTIYPDAYIVAVVHQNIYVKLDKDFNVVKNQNHRGGILL